MRFIDPGQLAAEGIVRSEADERTNRCYWYGTLSDGRRAIHEIGATATANDA